MDATKKRKADENGTNPTGLPLTNTDAQKLIAPLNADQLREILQSAVLHHADILDDVRTIVDRDSTLRKLFVRGLGADTTTETLKTLFSSFGQLDEAVVITDKSTGKSKGYGFVTFKHVDGAILALKEPSKKIDGRVTVTQLATAGRDGGGVGGGDVSSRKIYVGNVPFEVSSERLLEFFCTFGEIEEGPLGFDKSSGKPRGFAFFVYKSEDGAKAAVMEPMKVVDGHQVLCKFAVDNKKTKPGPGSGSAVGVQGAGMQTGPQGSSFPGSQFGGPAGMGSYHGPTGMAGGNYGYNSAMPPVLGAPGSQMMPSGVGGGYGGSQYGGSGPGFGEYSGMNNPGSFMHRGPPGSIGMPSGGYPDVGHAGLSSSGLPSQPPRIPPGGMYQGPPPYY